MKYLIPFLILIIASIYWLMPKEVFLKDQCEISSGECTIKEEGLNLQLALGPIPLNPNKHFMFNAKLSSLNIDNIEAKLIGLSFQHAPVDLPLKRKSATEYESKTLFPICTEKKMKWRIHLIIYSAGKKYKTNLDFEVERV